MIRVAPLTGADLAATLDEVARLRIAVFRDWPYLYDGDMGYERAYLAACRDSAGAIVVGAWAGDRLVGAATGTPLPDHADGLAVVMAQHGPDPAGVFYCAESVLLPEWRGRGIGHRFFDAREAHARSHGFAHAAFCAVIRPQDHPAQPVDYRALDPFWRARGYTPLPGAIARLSWTDIDQPAATEKPMQFWMRSL